MQDVEPMCRGKYDHEPSHRVLSCRVSTYLEYIRINRKVRIAAY